MSRDFSSKPASSGASDRPEPTPRQRALGRLGRRECSQKELIDYLHGRKGVDLAEAQAVVARLASEGLVDDLRYARMMIRHQALRGKGPRAIAQVLKQKGVPLPAATIEAICEEVGIAPERETAREWVERRYPKFREDRKVANRAYQALLRRGFNSQVARDTVFSKTPYRDADA